MNQIANGQSARVLTWVDLTEGGRSASRALLARYGIDIEELGEKAPVPGSHWGEPEAGLIGSRLYARVDTPMHSVLHEACHLVCMDAGRRSDLHTDAGGDYDEENAVCYLSIVLAGYVPGLGPARMMTDMDAWGYTFRLGSARAWFERDAEDACQWLVEHRILDRGGVPTWRLRQAQRPDGPMPSIPDCG